MNKSYEILTTQKANYGEYLKEKAIGYVKLTTSDLSLEFALLLADEQAAVRVATFGRRQPSHTEATDGPQAGKFDGADSVFNDRKGVWQVLKIPKTRIVEMVYLSEEAGAGCGVLLRHDGSAQKPKPQPLLVVKGKSSGRHKANMERYSRRNSGRRLVVA